MSDIESFLFGLRARGVKPGLEPTRAALDAIGAPDREFTVLQVAGTVGKGSTAAFAASVLQEAGVPCGLYTSPHLVRFCERFVIDGQPVDDASIEDAVDHIRQAAPWAADSSVPPPRPELRPLTFFEWATVIACHLFEVRGVETAVLEVGLGGRFDATTAAGAQVTAISRLGLDHQATLGNTGAQIANEKAGVIRPGVPVVSVDQRGEALEVLERRCEELAAPFHLLGRDFDLVGSDKLVFRGRKSEIEGIRLGLLGAHQVENAALALAALECLEEEGHFELMPEAVRDGLEGVYWPGRLQEIRPGLWLDGAHNPEAAGALARAIDPVLGEGEVHILFAALGGRSPPEMLAPLLPRAASIVLTEAGGERGIDPADYAAQLGHAEVSVERDPQRALATVRARGGRTLVCGSLYLVGAITALLEGGAQQPGDPAAVAG